MAYVRGNRTPFPFLPISLRFFEVPIGISSILFQSSLWYWTRFPLDFLIGTSDDNLGYVKILMCRGNFIGKFKFFIHD